MGMIFKEIEITGSNNESKQLIALLDTGTRINHISKKFRDGSSIYDLGIVEYEEEQSVILPNLTKIRGRMIKLKTLKIGERKPIEEPTFCLWDMKMCDIIIGAKLMQQLGITLNPSKKEINFG